MQRDWFKAMTGAAAVLAMALAARAAERVTGTAMIGELPLVVIPRGEEMKALSADLDGEDWKGAARLALACLGKESGEGLATEARVFCTQENLYVGWRCGEPDMEHVVTKGLEIWNHDSVELFIEPREELVKRPYHHVVVDLGGEKLFERGHVYPRYFQLRAFEEKWEPKAEVKVEKGQAGWVCVMRLAMADLHVGEEAKSGGLWRMNLCRTRPSRDVSVLQGGGMTWSWSNLAGGGFQLPARFGYAIPAELAKGDLAGRVAKLQAAAPRDESVAVAADAAFGVKVEGLIAGYWEKPELIKEIEAAAYLGNASYAVATKQVSAAIAERAHYAAARDLLYQLERDRPDLDPPPAEVTDRIARFEPFTQTNTDGAMGYRVFKPTMSEGQKYPLVVFLHGSAERGSDNQRQLFGGAIEYARDAVQSNHPCFVMAPQCGMTGGWADLRTNPESRPAMRATGNYRMAEKPGDMTPLLLEAIDAVMARNPAIDRERIYIAGSSMGGFGAWELMMRRPTFFAAGVILCGSGDETKAGLLKDMPIWDFHGALDKNVNPEASRMMKAAMEKVGGKAKFTEFPDRGHQLGTPNMDEETLEWMFAQRRGR